MKKKTHNYSLSHYMKINFKYFISIMSEHLFSVTDIVKVQFQKSLYFWYSTCNCILTHWRKCCLNSTLIYCFMTKQDKRMGERQKLQPLFHKYAGLGNTIHLKMSSPEQVSIGLCFTMCMEHGKAPLISILILKVVFHERRCFIKMQGQKPYV